MITIDVVFPEIEGRRREGEGEGEGEGREKGRKERKS